MYGRDTCSDICYFGVAAWSYIQLHSVCSNDYVIRETPVAIT